MPVLGLLPHRLDGRLESVALACRLLIQTLLHDPALLLDLLQRLGGSRLDGGEFLRPELLDLVRLEELLRFLEGLHRGGVLLLQLHVLRHELRRDLALELFAGRRKRELNRIRHLVRAGKPHRPHPLRGVGGDEVRRGLCQLRHAGQGFLLFGLMRPIDDGDDLVFASGKVDVLDLLVLELLRHVRFRRPLQPAALRTRGRPGRRIQATIHAGALAGWTGHGDRLALGIADERHLEHDGGLIVMLFPSDAEDPPFLVVVLRDGIDEHLAFVGHRYRGKIVEIVRGARGPLTLEGFNRFAAAVVGIDRPRRRWHPARDGVEHVLHHPEQEHQSLDGQLEVLALRKWGGLPIHVH